MENTLHQLNAAAVLQSLGEGVTVLPITGMQVEYRLPPTAEAIQVGLFPMQLACTDYETIEPERRAQYEADATRAAKATVCACCTSPKFVPGKGRGPKFNEVSVETLCPEDFTHLYRQIMLLVEGVYSRPAVNPDMAARAAQARKAIAAACAVFGLDPTEVVTWPAHRTQALLDWLADATINENGPKLGSMPTKGRKVPR